MKQLTLIRHAKSDWADPSLDDFDRPLNARGKKAAPMMGQRMLAADIMPTMIISSPAKRARKTAQLLACELDFDTREILYQKDIYEADLNTLIELVTQLPLEDHIAIVGHNPGMTDLGAWLCPEAPPWLPTCAVLTLDLDCDSWKEISQGCAHIISYDFPKKK